MTRNIDILLFKSAVSHFPWKVLYQVFLGKVKGNSWNTSWSCKYGKHLWGLWLIGTLLCRHKTWLWDFNSRAPFQLPLPVKPLSLWTIHLSVSSFPDFLPPRGVSCDICQLKNSIATPLWYISNPSNLFANQVKPKKIYGVLKKGEVEEGNKFCCLGVK